MAIEIKNRWTGAVIFAASVAVDIAGAIKEAIAAGADLRGANLQGADLRGADLRGANLRGANLRGADLRDADLQGANLRGANLRDANLRDANLTAIRDDVWAVLCSAPKEVPALRAALAEGRVNGSTYSGDCCCLVGTLAAARGCSEGEIPGLKPDSNRPAERWFLAINAGDTPETNPASAIALDWVDAWLANMRAAFGPEESNGTA